jgi:hypothetical protein
MSNTCGTIYAIATVSQCPNLMASLLSEMTFAGASMFLLAWSQTSRSEHASSVAPKWDKACLFSIIGRLICRLRGWQSQYGCVPPLYQLIKPTLHLSAESLRI